MHRSQLKQQLPVERYREYAHNAYNVTYTRQPRINRKLKRLLVETRSLTKHLRVLI